MGRKKNKKRRKLNYTKSEFTSLFCSKCMLCAAGTDPTFCFEQVYKQNPKLFVKVIFKHLQDLSTWLFDSGQDVVIGFDDSIEYIFKHAFCSSGFCGKKYPNGCDMIVGCLTAFRSQMKGGPKVTLDMSAPQGKRQKNKKNKKKERYVAKPYPTFFCNEPFKTEIEKFINEDNNSKQDKVTEPPALPEESASRTVEGNKS